MHNLRTQVASGQAMMPVHDADCELQEWPGPCCACAYRASLVQLEREREEDRQAIRDMAAVLVLFLHPVEPDCAACRVAVTHKATIARAERP